MSLLTIASLALKAGPAFIRGISGLFGGSDTATKVATAVESVDAMLGLSEEQKTSAICNELQKLPPEALVELESIKIELERELTKRKDLVLRDLQSEHLTTQETIRFADAASDRMVRLARPLMALISCCSACYYVNTNPNPDMIMAGFLMGLAATYMGLRHREKGQGIS